MNVQVPNLPFEAASPTHTTATFYDDFKEYCKTDEWRIFVHKQVVPLRDQYVAMTISPCQMNVKINWNNCYEALMLSIHRRNRVIGESKIRFEDAIYHQWREREKIEATRYQNYLLRLKRNDLSMRKHLHNMLRFFTSERGVWSEGAKEVHWMLSNHETRERMRCKLVENLQFDSHFEASRLRDYSSYENYLAAVASAANASALNATAEAAKAKGLLAAAAAANNTDSSSTATLTIQLTSEPQQQQQQQQQEQQPPKQQQQQSQQDESLLSAAAHNVTSDESTKQLAINLEQNKEAINTQINEDFVGDDDFEQSSQSQSQQQQQQLQQHQVEQMQLLDPNKEEEAATRPSGCEVRKNSKTFSFAPIRSLFKVDEVVAGDSGDQQQQTPTQQEHQQQSNQQQQQTQPPAEQQRAQQQQQQQPIQQQQQTFNPHKQYQTHQQSQEQYELFAKLEEKEKLIIKSDCELITVTRIIKGRFELTNKYIYFFDTFSSFYFDKSSSSSYAAADSFTLVNDANDPSNNSNNNNNGGTNSWFSCHDFDILNDFKIPLHQLKEVQLRRYNLRRSALEFFLINEANFFINFNKNVNLL